MLVCDCQVDSAYGTINHNRCRRTQQQCFWRVVIFAAFGAVFSVRSALQAAIQQLNGQASRLHHPQPVSLFRLLSRFVKLAVKHTEVLLFRLNENLQLRWRKSVIFARNYLRTQFCFIFGRQAVVGRFVLHKIVVYKQTVDVNGWNEETALFRADNGNIEHSILKQNT